jgi:hypothetical protein
VRARNYIGSSFLQKKNNYNNQSSEKNFLECNVFDKMFDLRHEFWARQFIATLKVIACLCGIPPLGDKETAYRLRGL